MLTTNDCNNEKRSGSCDICTVWHRADVPGISLMTITVVSFPASASGPSTPEHEGPSVVATGHCALGMAHCLALVNQEILIIPTSAPRTALDSHKISKSNIGFACSFYRILTVDASG